MEKALQDCLRDILVDPITNGVPPKDAVFFKYYFNFEKMRFSIFLQNSLIFSSWNSFKRRMSMTEQILYMINALPNTSIVIIIKLSLAKEAANPLR